MAELINMPRLSDTMEEGTVAKWYKKVGDSVKEGDILAEIETDKATMEFESFQEGELLHIGIKEGGTAPVDSLLAIIGDKGEDISSLLDKGVVSDDIQIDEDKTSSTQVSASSNEGSDLPPGVEVITVPRLSDTMEEGTVAKWNKKVGDKVSEGDILAEIETDKATMEFESFYSGVLLYIGLEEGASAPVDSILAAIGKEGTNLEQVKSALMSRKSSVVEPVKDNSTDLEVSDKSELTQPVPIEIEKPVVNQNVNGRLIASPLAKRLAEEKGMNCLRLKELERVEGLLNEILKVLKLEISLLKYRYLVAKESITEIANSTMRKAIAKRLSTSKFSAPHYYLGVEFNMDNAITFRAQFNTLPDTKISFNDIILKAVALSLKEHPQVNSQWFDDKIIQNHHVHLGVAVAVDDGLIVPVVKFTDELDLRQIGTMVKDFAVRAREKTNPLRN